MRLARKMVCAVIELKLRDVVVFCDKIGANHIGRGVFVCHVQCRARYFVRFCVSVCVCV